MSFSLLKTRRSGMVIFDVSLVFAFQLVACLSSRISRQDNFTFVHENAKELLKYIKNDYDKTAIPHIPGGLPFNVKIDIYVTTMEPIDQINMKFTLQMYFRQYWVDENMQFKRYNDSCIDWVSLDSEMISNVWIPDTFVENEVSKDVRYRAMRIWSNGQVLLSERTNIEVYCPLDLRRYPMDVQECVLKFESYSYDACELQYSLFYEGEGKSLRLAKSIELPNYDITGVQMSTATNNLQTGSYSRVLAKFQFRHKIMYILMRNYLPAAFIVITSWLSFYIDPAASPARVSLAVITVLSISTQLSNTFNSSPEVSYIKSIDWYMIGCFLFVFAAMIEYGFIHSYGDDLARTGARDTGAKHGKHAGVVNGAFEEFENGEVVESKREWDKLSRYRSNYQSNLAANDSVNNDAHVNNQDRSKNNSLWSRLTIKYHGVPSADAISRVAFPILFLTFNVVYWILVLQLSLLS